MLPGVFAIRAQFCPHPMQRLAGCHTNQGLACCLYFNKYSIKRQIMFFSSEQGFVVTNDYPSICLGSTEKPRVKKRNGTNQRNVLERRLREQESPGKPILGAENISSLEEHRRVRIIFKSQILDFLIALSLICVIAYICISFTFAYCFRWTRIPDNCNYEKYRLSLFWFALFCF